LTSRRVIKRRSPATARQPLSALIKTELTQPRAARAQTLKLLGTIRVKTTILLEFPLLPRRRESPDRRRQPPAPPTAEFIWKMHLSRPVSVVALLFPPHNLLLPTPGRNACFWMFVRCSGWMSG